MIYIDVNVFVYWLIDHEKYGERAWRHLKRLENGERGVTSILTLWLLHIILKNLAENYSFKNLLKRIESIPNLKIVSLDLETIRDAIAFTERYGIDLEDAIHLVTALKNNCRVIITNDEDFNKIKEIKSEF